MHLRTPLNITKGSVGLPKNLGLPTKPPPSLPDLTWNCLSHYIGLGPSPNLTCLQVFGCVQVNLL